VNLKRGVGVFCQWTVVNLEVSQRHPPRPSKRLSGTEQTIRSHSLISCARVMMLLSLQLVMIPFWKLQRSRVKFLQACGHPRVFTVEHVSVF
jgi:hypothetical protein